MLITADLNHTVDVLTGLIFYILYDCGGVKVLYIHKYIHTNIHGKQLCLSQLVEFIIPEMMTELILINSVNCINLFLLSHFYELLKRMH